MLSCISITLDVVILSTLKIQTIIGKINVKYMPDAYKYPSINKSGTFEILLGLM